MKSRLNRQRPQVTTTAESAILVAANGRSSHQQPRNRLRVSSQEKNEHCRVNTQSQIYYTEGSHSWGLQPFSFDTEISAATAKQDRIHVRLGSWKLKGTTAEIDYLREVMASPRVSHRDIKGLADSETYGRFFNRPQKHGSSRPPVSVRDRPLNIGQAVIPPPLFSGRWVFSKYACDNDSKVTTKTNLDLWLNLNVFVRYQSTSPWPDPSKPESWPTPRLFGHELPKAVAGAAAFDGKDNWVPHLQRLFAFTNSARSRLHLRRYFSAIRAEFEAELNRLNNLTGLPLIEIERSENAVLLLVETYWEFASDDPIKDVLNLHKPFLSITAGLRTIRFHPNVDLTVERNCVTLTADVAPGIQLRIYAKTNARVRVEVVHTLGRNKHQLAGGHTTESWDQLPQMIETLAERAALTVNWAFEHFRNQTFVVPSTITADDLLLQIGVHSRDGSTAKMIKDALVHFDGIAAAGNSDAVARALQRLSKTALLEYRPNAGQGGNYVATAPYRAGLQQLRQREGLSRFATDSAQSVAQAV